MSPATSSSPAATVSAVQCPSYDYTVVLQALRELLQPLGGIKSCVPSGSRVLLKPNILSGAAPEKAVTTHPAVVEAVVVLVKEAGGIPFVGDSPGVGDPGHAIKGSGIAAVCQKHNVSFANFTDSCEINTPENVIGKKLLLAQAVQDTDIIITLPKLKTHVQMVYTGALKNQYGLIPGLRKGQYHFRLKTRDRLADLMIDINRAVKPVLAIMDAVTAMEGDGPGGGDPKHIGALLASTDVTALDVVACQIIGQKPENVPVIAAAKRQAFGTTHPDNIKLTGCSVNELHVPDFVRIKDLHNILGILPLPAFLLQWVSRYGAAKPRIKAEACIHCGKCSEGCPVTPPAIDPESSRRKKVNDATCIRCYCCHEFCPAKAITLKRSLLDYMVLFAEKCGSVGQWFMRKIPHL